MNHQSRSIKNVNALFDKGDGPSTKLEEEKKPKEEAGLGTHTRVFPSFQN